MYSFFSLFACSTDSISSEALDAQGFTPDLLFIHELWLHPGEPDRPMNPRGDANVSLKLYGPHYPRTRSPDDVCSWYGNLSDIEIQSLDYPYGLKSRLRMTQSDCPKEFADQLDGSHLTLQIEPLVSAQQNNLERIYRQEEKDVDEVLPFALGVRSGIGAQEQAPFQEQGWALSYQMDEGKVALDGDELILQQTSSTQPNRALRIMGLAPSPFAWFWYD